MKRIILSHSGSVDSAAAIQLIAERFSAEVIAVIVDLGRRTDLVELRERALSLGAIRCHVVDSREEFARRHLLPALQAGAFASDRAPVTAALGRPMVARKIVELARMEGADAIAYGAGRGFDRASLDVLIRALDSSIERVASSPSRDVTDDAGPHKIAANIWGRAVSFDPLKHTSSAIPEETYMLTRAPEDCPDQPATVELQFENGIPVRVNGIEMSLLEMIESLEIIGGTHGIGRTDTLVTRPDGVTFREIGEAPAAVILQTSHAALGALVIASELTPVVTEVGRAYAEMIRSGGWFSKVREALDLLTAAIQPNVSGSVRMTLFKGECRVVDRKAAAAADDNQLQAPDAVTLVRHVVAPGPTK